MSAPASRQEKRWSSSQISVLATFLLPSRQHCSKDFFYHGKEEAEGGWSRPAEERALTWVQCAPQQGIHEKEQLQRPKSYGNSLTVLKSMDIKRCALKRRACSRGLAVWVHDNNNAMTRQHSKTWYVAACTAPREHRSHLREQGVHLHLIQEHVSRGFVPSALQVLRSCLFYK